MIKALDILSVNQYSRNKRKTFKYVNLNKEKKLMKTLSKGQKIYKERTKEKKRS